MRTKMLALLCAIAGMWLGLPAVAASLAILGTPTYSISGTSLQFSSQVQNTGTSASSNLRMEMWAFSSTYFGGALTGYKLADTGPLPSLGGGFVRTYAQYGPFAEPPAGTWVFTLIWTEQDGAVTNEGFSPRAWANLAPHTFGTGATPPSTPTGLVSRVISPSEVGLRWNASAGPSGPASNYRILSNGSIIGTVVSTAASVTGLSPATNYTFSISACDSKLNCSAQSATTSVATFPAGTPSVANFTGLWWNSSESGWGINVNHQGSTAFATLYTYDTSGNPMWLVMSNGLQQGTSTIFVGDLYSVTGPAFNSDPFPPIGPANLSRVGTMTVNFGNSFSGTLTYSVNGSSVVKSISKMLFGSRTALCNPTTASRVALTNYQDLWWNPAESGWGINVTHQDQTLFATLYTYDSGGRNLWLVMSGGTRQADGSYVGDLFRTHGPPFNAQPFTPIGAADLTKVGEMRFQFIDGANGLLTYSVNGVLVSKAISRMEFSTPVPSCTS